MLGAYLIGVATAPLLVKVVKPVVRAVVKASVEVAMEVQKTAVQVSEGLQEIAAEAVPQKAAEFVERTAESASAPPRQRTASRKG